MSDLAFNLETALELLAEEERRSIECVQQKAAELERELRAVAAAINLPPELDPIGSELFHVFDVDTTTGYGLGFPFRPGHSIDLSIAGNRLASSALARELPVGKYRAILQLTKVE